jgi:hypothetical protein
MKNDVVAPSNLPSPELLRQASDLLNATPSLTAADLVLRLRKSFASTSPALVALAAETAIARIAAKEKLGGWSAEGVFPSALLEQASRSAIANYRAHYFYGRQHVLEIGTGTGSDTGALARNATHVTSIESDPQRYEAAAHNLAVQGFSNVTLLCGDAQTVISSLDLSRFDALFADPARRTKDGTRVRTGDDYLPPLSWIRNLPVGTLRAIKISPGLFVETADTGWIRQFIGVGAECLEQTLWYGSTIVDSSVYLADTQIGWAPSQVTPPCITDTIEGWIVEAHGAINRSQHLHDFFAQHGITMLDSDIAYGITDAPPAPTPLMTVFRIVESFPYNVKRLKEALNTLGWTSRTEFKKRNFLGDLEEIRSTMHLKPHTHNAPYGTIFLFKWHNKTWVVLAQRQQ